MRDNARGPGDLLGFVLSEKIVGEGLVVCLTLGCISSQTRDSLRLSESRHSELGKSIIRLDASTE
jgi:hypothetical protein